MRSKAAVAWSKFFERIDVSKKLLLMFPIMAPRSSPSLRSSAAILSVLAVVSSLIESTNAFSPHHPTPASRIHHFVSSSRSQRTAHYVLPIDDDETSEDNNNMYEQFLPQHDKMPLTPSPMREARLEREEAIRKRYATGEELRNLREDVASLKENLTWSQAAGDVRRVNELKAAIKDSEERDPELVYAKALAAIKKAENEIKDLDKRKFVVEQHTSEANMARACIQRFNLQGLWVGNYGNGAQLVNITYSGDTLIATKVTGDEFIPRGENTFSANLAPSDEADPIVLSDAASSKWGAKKLQRFVGEGFVALEDFKDQKSVDGQMVMFDDYFSFTWIPMKYTVFFSRPSPRATIEMLRNIISKEDEVDNMREHITKCFEMDVVDVRNYSPKSSNSYVADNKEPFRRIPCTDDVLSITEESGEVKSASKLAFLKLDKLKGYIDGMLE